MHRLLSAATALLILTTGLAEAVERIPLNDVADPVAGWTFDNGREFPGATGRLETDRSEKNKSLKLTGDFTGGGGYVQGQRAIPDLDVRELSFQVRAEGAEEFTLRLGDGSGQCHQIVMRLDPAKSWQSVTLPLEKFFRDRGTANAITNIARYESWGGAKDGKWHGPAKYVCFLLGNGGNNRVRTLWFRDLEIIPEPKAVAGAEVMERVPLDEVIDGAHEWTFSNGPEFKGATGGLEAEEGEGFHLHGDFTNGGAYCAALRTMDEFQAADLKAIRMEARSANAATVSVQLVDASGQTHQRKGIAINKDGKWHELVIDPKGIAGGEHWGGANDGQWHGPAKLFSLSVTAGSDAAGKRPDLWLRGIRGEFLLPVFTGKPALAIDFNEGTLPSDWKIEGGVTVEAAPGGSPALKLSRSVDQAEKPCGFVTTTFPVVAGRWQAGLRAKPELESPDNSYHCVIALEVLGSSGNSLATLSIGELFGKHDWQSLNATLDLPAGATSARIKGSLQKAWGTLWLDDLTLSPLQPAPLRAGKIERLLFSTASLGNLLLPDDSRKVEVEVISRKPLAGSSRALGWSVSDYWGVEQQDPAKADLTGPERKDGKFVYKATLDLGGVALETGRYYEVHAGIDGEHFENHTALAILPEAVTHRHRPDEVPFTARNWDNRIPEFIRLSHRLGIRMCGVWGGWSAQPPYTPQAPGLELVKELGMGWVTGTPAAEIERGSTTYDEKSLREGMRNFLKAYGNYRPLVINLGNEPHGTGDRVLKNVEAYRALYEEVKKFDPTLPVIATSVEPNEEYFKAGYGKFCDAFDFHIYESADNVRRTIGEYRELEKRHGVEKPIWSTELGLNSQGMTRLAVASELPKKFATFFAAGGKNVSWFGLLYPDADGSSHGSSGDSHNVFDCRFNRYNPRLDAVAYYHAVNAISVKRFIEEKTYPDGTRAVLFRDSDDQSLVVMWNDKARRQVELRLTGADHLKHIAIDGRSTELRSTEGGYRLSVGMEPVLLEFSGTLSLPTDLPKSSLQISATSDAGKVMVTATTPENTTDVLELTAPPRWQVKDAGTAQGQHRYELNPPAETKAREVEVILGSRDGRTHLPARVMLTPQD